MNDNQFPKSISAIILAAGKGTRIGQKLPKALYPIAGKPMLHYTLNTLGRIPISDVKVVVGYRAPDVKASIGERVDYVYQEKQLGTAHAVGQAVHVLPPTADTVLVINCDDSAFYEPATLRDFVLNHQRNQGPVSMISLELENPSGLGRIVRDENNKLAKIVEEKDATAQQREIKEINAGCYLFDLAWLRAHVHSLESSQVTGEFYITELIGLALRQDHPVYVHKLKNPKEFKQVNTLDELNNAHQAMVGKLAKMHAPRTTVIDLDNTILDTDRLKSDLVSRLHQRLTQTLGLKMQFEQFSQIYHKHYHLSKKECGLVDVSDFCKRVGGDIGLAQDGALEEVFLSFPFSDYVFDKSAQVLEFLRRWSRLVLFADGDMVYEPVKVSGIKLDRYFHDVYIAEKKSDLLDDLITIYGSSLMLFIDDRLENLFQASKKAPNSITIWLKQGEHAQGVILARQQVIESSDGLSTHSSNQEDYYLSFEPTYQVDSLDQLLEVLQTQVYGWA